MFITFFHRFPVILFNSGILDGQCVDILTQLFHMRWVAPAVKLGWYLEIRLVNPSIYGRHPWKWWTETSSSSKCVKDAVHEIQINYNPLVSTYSFSSKKVFIVYKLVKTSHVFHQHPHMVRGVKIGTTWWYPEDLSIWICEFDQFY